MKGWNEHLYSFKNFSELQGFWFYVQRFGIYCQMDSRVLMHSKKKLRHRSLRPATANSVSYMLDILISFKNSRISNNLLVLMNISIINLFCSVFGQLYDSYFNKAVFNLGG